MTTEPIERVLRDYFSATHAGDAARVRALFTQDARIQGIVHAAQVNLSLSEFVDRLAARPTAQERGEAFDKHIVSIEQRGRLAVALAEVMVQGQLMVDALTLCRAQDETWRIASKTFGPIEAPNLSTTTARRNDVEVRVVARALTSPERHIEVFARARLVAFTRQLAHLDARGSLPSSDLARSAAIATLTRVAPDLLDGLELQWIEPHDEGFIGGIKVKLRQADGRYAWVVVGANGEPITFERDVVWSTGMGKRLTEQLLQ